MKTRLTNFFLVLTSVLVGLFVVEVGLKVLGIGGLYKSGISRIADPELRYRLPGNLFPEIDSDGFRNTSNDGPFDIVILGDSHVYGYGVSAEDSYPKQLAAITGKKVYNFGMGGYGPAQYAHLADKALDLNPDTLVVSLFMGNDPVNACEIANLLTYWKDYFDRHNLTTPSCGSRAPAPVKMHRSITSRLKAWVKSTRTGSLINQHVWLPIKNQVLLSSGSGSVKGDLFVNEADLKSIFPTWPNNTEAASDGIRITKHFLSRIKVKADKKSVTTVLAIFPSKQSVYLEKLQNMSIEPGVDFIRSVEAERRYVRGLSRFAADTGYGIADVSSRLIEASRKDIKLYPADDDSHPTARGYAIYARAVAENLP
jgi:hypothetical protein